MMHVMPMKRLITMRKIYAVLGSVNTNDAGYIIGVIDHLIYTHTDIIITTTTTIIIITTFLLQHLSIALQRGNAVSFQNTMNTT